VEISNRPPNLSAKQSEVTVCTKKPSAKEKTYWLRKKLYFAPTLPKNCPKIAQKLPKFAKKKCPKKCPKQSVKNFF
jgi:hypothetical protein